MLIKQADVTDAKTISKIHALSWKIAYQGLVPQQYLDELQHDFWVNTFNDWISNNKVNVKILYDNNLPLGCITYGKSRDSQLPDWGEIISVYILPEYIGKGFGKKLLDSALSDMRKQGINSVYLWVLEENKYARKFYAKNGFICDNEKYTFEILNKPLVDVRYIIRLRE